MKYADVPRPVEAGHGRGKAVQADKDRLEVPLVPTIQLGGDRIMIGCVNGQTPALGIKLAEALIARNLDPVRDGQD